MTRVAGKVSYHVNKTGMEDSLVFNTLIVPKGGEYSLELSRWNGGLG